MAARAGATAWPVRLPVADFGALSVGGVFDEVDILVSLAKKGSVSLCCDCRIRQLQVSALGSCGYASFSMMLPQPRSLRGTVQRRPSHRSNYFALLLPSAASSGLFISRSMLPLKFCSYLSKYLILQMLNYYPI
jgi:hypothetical protein